MKNGTKNPFENLTEEQDQKLAAFFSDIGTIWQSLETRGKSITQLLDNQIQLRGSVLTYHLVAEHVLTMELKQLKHLGKIHSSVLFEELPFTEKLKLIPANVSYVDILPCLKELNHLRNRLAHNLNFKPRTDHIPKIRKYVYDAYEENGTKLSADLDAILRSFLKISIFLFAIRTGDTGNKLRAFRKKYPKTKNLVGYFIE